MNGNEYEAFERAGASVIRRLSAENTWLRHSHMEMERRVDALGDQVTSIKREANVVIKSLRAAAAAQSKRLTRSKQ